MMDMMMVSAYGLLFLMVERIQLFTLPVLIITIRT